MGLGLVKKERLIFEQLLAENSVHQRAQCGDTCGPTTVKDIGAPPAAVCRVIVDACPFFRRHASTRTEVTAQALAEKLVYYVLDLVSPQFMENGDGPAPEVLVMFDTQANMPTARSMVAAKRNPLATPEELDRVRLDPKCTTVVVNGRLFSAEERPFTAKEIMALEENEHVPFWFCRAMNSRAGKEAVWALLEKTVVKVFAELGNEKRRVCVTVDGPGTGPTAVTRIERGPEGGTNGIVKVTQFARKVQWGEADLKAADASQKPIERPNAAQVIVTNDRDQICQQLILSSSRSPSCRNCFIHFLPHVMSRGPAQWMDTYGFPTCGRGSTLAFLLVFGGSDYTVSMLGVGLRPGQAVETDNGIFNLQKCFSVSEDFPRGVIHTGGVVDAICRSFTGKKTAQVFSFDEDSGQFFISKQAALASASAGKTVRKRPRTLKDLHSQLKDVIWLLQYWSLAYSNLTPAGPPPLPESVTLFELRSPLQRFLQTGKHFEPATSIPL